jgi:hypothetical protein
VWNSGKQPNGDETMSNATAAAITIMADHEYNAELFWQNLAEQLPVIAQQLQSGATEVDAETWAQIQQIEGFSGGPAHAPHAIVEVMAAG